MYWENKMIFPLVRVPWLNQAPLYSPVRVCLSVHVFYPFVRAYLRTDLYEISLIQCHANPKLENYNGALGSVLAEWGVKYCKFEQLYYKINRMGYQIKQYNICIYQFNKPISDSPIWIIKKGPPSFAHPISILCWILLLNFISLIYFFIIPHK